MQVRFFGGWDYPETLCEDADLVAAGYAGGVPMGGDLPPRSEADTPTFLVSGLADPGTLDRAGTDLQRLQIVKGWFEDDEPRENVFDVAGDPNNGASVDPLTCNTTGRGTRKLCTVWRDPDFDPKLPAMYYARVVENPSCRWNAYVCLAARVDCASSAGSPAELAPCCDPDVPTTIQERAWTSPIWYTPTEEKP
jgi:hypothetical protein